MADNAKKLFVISLGGSLVFPDEIDIRFLKNFKNLIARQIKRGGKFIFVVGGGKICRKYQKALREVANASVNDIEWLGIYTTKTNAELVRLSFGKLAYPNVASDPTKKTDFKQPILTASGWKPGASTDRVAIKLAETYGSKTVINLSNIDYVYTKDPRKFKDAKKITDISWAGFRQIVGNKWDPGKNLPFDPVAAKLAQNLGLRVIIANGKNLKNLQNILEGKKFQGTTIS